jgi:pyrimidine operon attenuation protein/uracil phosphoribosyltransferase
MNKTIAVKIKGIEIKIRKDDFEKNKSKLSLSNIIITKLKIDNKRIVNVLSRL